MLTKASHLMRVLSAWRIFVRMSTVGVLKRLLAMSLLCAAGSGARAQEKYSHVQFSVSHFEKIFKDDGFAPVALRVSYVRDLRPELASAVDIHVLWRSVLSLPPRDTDSDQLRYAGATAYYRKNVREWGLNYRTMYFFAGDMETGVYVGMNVGVRKIRGEITITSQFPNGWQEPVFKERYEGKAVIVPIGLRTGVSGAYTYGARTDWYFGVSYQIGAGAAIIDAPELEEAPVHFARLVYSFGFGWMIGL